MQCRILFWTIKVHIYQGNAMSPKVGQALIQGTSTSCSHGHPTRAGPPKASTVLPRDLNFNVRLRSGQLVPLRFRAEPWKA